MIDQVEEFRIRFFKKINKKIIKEIKLKKIFLRAMMKILIIQMEKYILEFYF